MTSITNYNLLKEGDVYNESSLATYEVSTSGIGALYDGNFSVLSYEVPASGTSSISVRFGEYFDVGCLKYFISPIVLSDISISYGLETAYENYATTVSSGTYVFVDVSGPIGYLNVTHSGTSSVDIYQLFIEGVENNNIGFGLTSNSGVESSLVSNSPVGYSSSSPLEVPVYNDYPYTADIKVAVAPTGADADAYIYLSTSEDGIFYGINEYGITQPSHTRITTQSESFDFDGLEDLYSKWDFTQCTETYLHVGDGFLRFNVLTDNVNVFRKASPWTSYHSAFFVNKSEFTADQSFTISIDFRYKDATLDTMEGIQIPGNKFMVGFTNSFPILEHSSLGTTGERFPTYERQGRSQAFVWCGGMLGYGEYNDLFVGGGANDCDFDSYEAYTDFNEIRDELTNSHPILSAVGLEHLSRYVFGEDLYSDGTESARWRTLKLSYDHIRRKAYYYIDKVSLGEYTFTPNAFAEACKFYFGFLGYGAAIVDVKDFSVELDTVHQVVSSQCNANAYSSKDDDHGPDKMIDGLYSIADYDSCWVSDDGPSVGDYFSLKFTQTQEVEAVRVRYPDMSSNITISGASSSPSKYTLGTVSLHFDTGDTRIADFYTYESSGLDGWAVSYLTTLSGTVESVSNTTSVSGIIYTLNEREADVQSDVLAIDEIEFYTVSSRTNEKSWESEDRSYCWRRGKTRNLVLDGSDNMYRLQYDDRYDVCLRYDAYDLMLNAEYYFTSPVFDVLNLTQHHYGEALFCLDDRTNSEVTMYSGRVANAWRVFDDTISLKSVFFEFYVNPSSGNMLRGKVDKWKIQYLAEGGNPFSEDDWRNIPPITSSYPTSCSYKTYTDYLVSNNDGEYYTDFINAFDVSGTVTIPEDLYCYKNRFFSRQLIYPFYGSTSALCVEFDQAYRTQAVRVVIADGYMETNRNTPAIGYTAVFFMCYGEKAVGSYTSPIFDTLTKQNTERVFVNTDLYGGAVSTLYRSSDTPPSYRHDSAYEMWENLGEPFGGLSEPSSFDPFIENVSMVGYGNLLYLLGGDADSMMTYDVLTCKWSWSEDFPIETSGESIVPDIRTRNNTVVVGDSIICSSYSSDGSTFNSSLMRYYLVSNAYGISGWVPYPYQRQPEATYAGMVSDGESRVFFLSVDGDITVFYLSTGDLDTEGRQTMPMHGASSRTGFIPAYHAGKIYVCGGFGTGYKFDIYDVDGDTWEEKEDMPFSVGYSWAMYYDGFIYVLPYSGASQFDAFLKYDIENDVWLPIPSLGWNFKTSNLTAYGVEDSLGNKPVPFTYCLLGDYIYAYSWVSKDFRRFKIKRESWESGYLASKDEVPWRNVSGYSWRETVVSGEAMPQDRYIQYKVAMEVDDAVVSPLLKGSSVVLPQTIADVPAAGSGKFFIKTGISLNTDIECWYTGFDADSLPTTIYGKSTSGESLYYATTAFSRNTVSGTGFVDYGYCDSFVYKDVSSYTMWATHAKLLETSPVTFELGNIHMAESTNGIDWGTFEHVIGRNTEGVNDYLSVSSPTVVVDVTFEMWYTGIDALGVGRIMHATSVDGRSWGNVALSKDKGTYLLDFDADMNGAINPSVVKVEGVYHMWYEGLDSNDLSSIVYCTSLDGMSWAGHETVISSSDIEGSNVLGCGKPCVISDLDNFRMWFIVNYRDTKEIYYSTSYGGLLWSTPIFVTSRKQEGSVDFLDVGPMSTCLNRAKAPTNVMHNAKIKIYND